MEWKSAVYRKVGEETQAHRGLSIRRMLELGRVSRSSFYHFDPDGKPGADRDMDLRDAMQRIALEWLSYGRPRITAELRRQGWTVNPKRVYRLMREDNLLCLRRRKFVITTDSDHDLLVYPNRAHALVLTGLDQLWVADITYIRLELEFVYLAVILDAFSRRVLGWALDRTLKARLPLEALRMALEQRQPSPGLVHHSDRGVQYASTDYTDLLKENGIVISMSRRGNPYDNATCESFLIRQFEKQKQIRLSPAVRDYKTAGHWLTELGGSGFDGVVAKQLDCTYLLRRAQRHAEDQAFRRLHRCVSQQELDSPPLPWHSLAQVLRKSCGTMCCSPALSQQVFTTH